MSGTESRIQREIRLAASAAGLTLWRNNVGTAWQSSKRIWRGPSELTLIDPRPVHFGLCAGAADLIGLKTIVVTPTMVGERLAVFAAIEVKAPRGRTTAAQRTFHDFVSNAGGIARVARSAEDIHGV